MQDDSGNWEFGLGLQNDNTPFGDKLIWNEDDLNAPTTLTKLPNK